jgi:4-amino-4-deoxy-L-arabinose transferase-like glycosyltransferase
VGCICYRNLLSLGGVKLVAIWLFVNLMIIVGMVAWSLLHQTDGLFLQFATVFSQFAVILILLNLNMYFIFLIIRKSKKRKVKLTLAKISRKVMKVHVPIAISAASLIILHIIFIVFSIPFDLTKPKLLTGLLAAIGLIFTLIAGYLRSKKASGTRRKLHILTAFVFFLMALLHIFSTY